MLRGIWLWPEKVFSPQFQSSFLEISMLIRKVNIWITTCRGQQQWSESFECASSFRFSFFISDFFFQQRENHIRPQTNSADTEVFNKDRAAVETSVCCVYFSILYQEAIWPVDWTQGKVIGWCEKNGGLAGSLSLEKGQRLQPFDNTCQGLAHTPCILWMGESAASSLQSALICTFGKQLNDQMLGLMKTTFHSFCPLIRFIFFWSSCSVSTRL